MSFWGILLLAWVPVAAVAAPFAAPEPSFADAFPTSLNVKNFGAVGDGQADDTKAIQAAADEAAKIESAQRMRIGTARGLHPGTKSSAYPEIYFPEGTYRISETILFQQSAALRGSGRSTIRQTDPEKDSFYFHYSFRYVVEGITFDGGKTQLRFWTGNIWSRIIVARCLFLNSSGYAVECNSYTEEKLTGKDWNRSKPWPPYTVEPSDGGWKLARNQSDRLKPWYNSTVLSIDSSRFENCMKAISVRCDTAVLSNSSILTHPEMEGAAFDLGGQIRVSNLKGKARINPKKHQYWIEGEGNMAFRNIELDTDSDQGIAFIHSLVKPTPTTRGLRIENAILKTGGSRENAIVWIKEGTMPNILSISNVTELSATPVKAVAWEEKGDFATLEKIKFYSGTPVEKQYRIVIGNNGPGIDETLPDAFRTLAEKPIAPEILKETVVAPLAWSDAPANGGKWTVIDAREHGVDPQSKHDQSEAIQRVFDQAAKQPDAIVVFPGAASYRISETIRLPSVVRINVAGVCRFIQTDSKKPVFDVANAERVVFRNIDFVGGRNAVTLRAPADAKSAILFEHCSFYDQELASIRCFAGEGEEAQPNRMDLLVRNAIFRSEQALVTNANRSEIATLWAMTDPHIHEKAFFENRGGAMRIQSMLGNPNLWFGAKAKVPKGTTDWPYSRNARWVDNWGKLFCEDNRFGGESGGMCNVFNRSPEGTVYISGGLTRSNNGATRRCILFAEAMPRVAVLREISAGPGGESVQARGADGYRLEKEHPKIHAAGMLAP